jgi:uncharacterized phage protein gp47/JayE
MAAPSFQDLYDLGKAEAIIKRPRLRVLVGDLADMLIAGAAAMADRVIGYVAERFAATYLDGAQGDDLTTLAADHWGIARRAALKATGILIVHRGTPDASVQTIPVGTIFATERDSSGQELRYLSTALVSWAGSEDGQKLVPLEAETAGIDHNVAADAVTRFLSNEPTGGVYTLASLAMTGGMEEETDEELRERVRTFPSTLRRGTLGALEYGALQTPGAGVAVATAVADDTGFVTVFVADASGGSTGLPKMVDPDTPDNGTMTAKVAIELLNWAPAGSLVQVMGGVVQTVDVELLLTVRLGVDVNQLIADVQVAVEARMARLKIGETLYLSNLINAVKAVDPDNIVNVEIESPLTDTAPSTPGSLIRAGTVGVS